MTRFEIIRAARPLRMAALGFAGSAALVAGAQHLSAQGIASHNSDAPVNYLADRIEVQDKAKRVVLSGNVDISQTDLRLQAARTTVAYSDAGGIQIDRIDATGGVQVTRGSESARGDVAVYDFGRNIITMTGNVALRRGGDTLNGGRLVIDLDSGLSSVDGRSGAANGAGSSRVSGTFKVRERD
ncbi:OstA family protein [Novosphingobium sp. AAP83]|uniref:LptA/OstA family protein n=1 Tax=Novosphingobium sp. AAP83 TaxID=1523425 RepID=UPI0006B9218D|nr:LptA/OstA family protein [Novosphingobium sp. AAP83]KPF93963.1 OstA family protein [Novosphingobium sp. AAP83]